MPEKETRDAVVDEIKINIVLNGNPNINFDLIYRGILRLKCYTCKYKTDFYTPSKG
jgi:hypothetical protein